MVSFLFWNVAKNKEAGPFIRRLARRFEIDIFFLAECPKQIDSITLELNRAGVGDYLVADRGVTKVRSVSRLSPSHFFLDFNNVKGDLSIWNLAVADPRKGHIQVAVTHLVAKAGGTGPSDQQAAATEIARDIIEYEDREKSQDTILVGDLNMNPFEPGMVIVSGLHAAMTRRIAELPNREWREKHYRRFYNPMWGLFGDRTPGPAATYFWDKSVPSNHHWHMLDQVLLRPSLIKRLRDVRILDSDGDLPLVDNEGKPTREYLSDHLPVLFQIDF
jgi:endonuclease/exonuclease/phosphatase family metal-dependent hydrolase